MASSKNPQAAPDRPPGLRERKRQQTRDRLTRSAMALFLERGFDATTLDEIVAAAEVSRRSFFHYFSSKEEVVFAWQDTFDAALNEAVAKQPPDLPPLRAVEQGMIAVLGAMGLQESLAIVRLIHGTPALRARDQAKYEALERSLSATLAARCPDDPGGLQARLVAMVAIGALRVATEIWLADEGRAAPVESARQVFARLRAALKD